ncbi:MAG: YggT family protein [Elusimicrobia bacterium]|nr:YggT family protein [Elusimicrobiota bacterium]
MGLFLCSLVSLAAWIYGILVLARGITIWVKADQQQPGVQFLVKATEPLLAPVRGLFPNMTFDISPIIVLVGIAIAERILIMLFAGIFFAA